MSKWDVSKRFSDWPLRDQRLWVIGIRQAGLFEGGGAGRNWSTASRYKTSTGYGCWLQYLAKRGLLDVESEPGSRVTKDRVKAYLDALEGSYSPFTIAGRVQELYDAMRVLAPDRDWTWLRRLMMYLHANAESKRDKRPYLRMPSELVELGEQLMAEAESRSTVGRYSKDRAALFRDGLAIAFLAYRPIRMKNLASMRIGRHLVNVQSAWWIQFPAKEMKGRRKLQVKVPDRLAGSIERYLTVHREALLHCQDGRIPPDPDALWISERSTALEQDALADRIRKHTADAFGLPLTPHWFRDACATHIAIENPEYVSDTMLVLVHADPRPGRKYYNQARALDASRRHNEVLEALWA
jgi:integrase